MSNNADSCPHCGETAFFIRRDRNVPVDRPCDAGYGCRWERCSGRGWYYRLSVAVVMCQIVFEGADMSNVRRLKDGAEYRFSPGNLADARIAQALCSGDYVVESEGSAVNQFWRFYYERVICPECGGRGKIRVWETESEWEDIRKPVK